MDRPPAAPGSRFVLFALGAVLLLALGSRLALAASKSLVIDEFHSYYHATQPSFEALLAGLTSDNHPPLSFLIIGVSRAAMATLTGTIEPGEWALRLPAIVFGLLEIAVVARLAGRLAGPLPGTGAALVAAALVAASSLHLDYGTQARMYTPYSLAVTVSLCALVELLARDEEQRGAPGRGVQVLLALAAAAAFHLHYFAVQYLSALGVAAIFGAVVGGHAARLPRLVAPVLGAVALCLPWAWKGFRAQLDHALPPGGDDLGLRALAESFVHLFFHNVSFAGPVLGWAFVAGAGLILLCAARGALVLLGDRGARTAGVMLVTVAVLVPIASWALARAVPRAGFTWHYVLPSTAAMAALAGVGASAGSIAGARPFRWMAVTAIALAATLSALHLSHPATEDFRGAVERALAEAGSAPAGSVTRVVSVEWQPALFPQGQPYDYYAPRLREDPPEREPMIPHEFMVRDRARLLEAERVIVIRRSLPNDQPLMRALLDRFGEPRVVPFGYGLDVRIFENERR